MVFSSSRAEVFGVETCTVISGMAMSGSRETGRVKYVTSPTMKQAVKAISTAMGRCIRNLTILFYSLITINLLFDYDKLTL